jgi:S-(hydroxymethyl)glutathione dehydrogenase/alcohol dehydrogenase
VTTVAAVLEQLNTPLSLQELPLPILNRGQVLVAVAYSGVCRSQLNEIYGFKGKDTYLPHTLGHEGSGVVIDTGPGVSKIKPGDHVVLTWIKGNGLDGGGCRYGQVNSGPISTFLSKAVVSENRLVPIPKEMPLREAALLGCAAPTGAGVILNQMQVRPGQSLAIFGLGGVGTCALLAARYAQASPLIAVDVSEAKLERAKQLGATHVLNPLEEDPLAAIREWTQGQGADYALECAGRKEVMELAVQAVKMTGGLCVLAGNLPRGQRIEIDPFELIAGKRVMGTWGGGSQIDRDVERYAALHVQGALSLHPLITHETPLENINVLLKELEAGVVGRGLVFCSSSLAPFSNACGGPCTPLA